MPKRYFEVYHPKMGFRTYQLDSPYSAVEKMADEYDQTYDLQIVRGCTALFAVRPANSKEPYKWYQARGRSIPVYNLDALSDDAVDPLYLAAFNRDSLQPAKVHRV